MRSILHRVERSVERARVHRVKLARNEFLCDLFVNQYDPSNGPKSAFTRIRLPVYRKKAGNRKYIEKAVKLASLNSE